MNREPAPAYDYQAKGASDFAAGRKDERLYANPENHGASYRQGWQQARRDAEARQDPRPEPAPVEAKETPVEVLKAVLSAPAVTQAAERVMDAAFPVTAEQVRLQTGEDKPKKPKPANPDQLAFF